SGNTSQSGSSVENTSAPLHDEIQTSGYSGSTSQSGSSVENTSAPLHDEIQTSGYSGSTSQGGSSVENTSAPLHDEIQTSGYSGSTSQSGSSVENTSAPLHDEIQTSGYSGSTSQSGSSVENTSAPLHEEIQTSGYSGSTSQGGSFVENSTAPATSQHEPPIIMPRGMDQAQRQVAATQEPRQEKETIKQDQVPASTSDIPMPHQNRTETRNIAHVVHDNVKGKIGNVKNRIESSPTLHKTKRSYQIGRNTGQDLRKLVSKKQKKLDEK
ncbi:hypothetical protein KM927_27720, partial [Priestia megaterium]|uniref:hypothetical protein n=1 Tax=Priestia megaterium TaxID=1404 RepID=UPI001C218428